MKSIGVNIDAVPDEPPADLIGWSNWLDVHHPNVAAERDSRFRLACAVAQSVEVAPVTVRCDDCRAVVLEVGATPHGVLLVVRLRRSDRDGSLILANGRRVPWNHDLFAQETFSEEPLLAIGDVLWWPPGVPGPQVAAARCCRLHSDVAVPLLLDAARKVPPGATVQLRVSAMR